MDFVGRRNLFFLISFVVMLVSIISLLLPDGLNAGLEFTGGSSMTLEFQENVSQEDLRSQFTALGHPKAVIQRLGEGRFFIRTRTLEESQSDEPSERERIVSDLQTNLGPGVEISDGMLTNSTHGLCKAVLGEVWCPCISYSATSNTRLKNLSAISAMCICGHDYSWHSAVPGRKLEYPARSRHPV